MVCIFAFYFSVQVWAEADSHAHHKAMLKNSMSFKQSTQNYTIPDLILQDKKGENTSTADLFDDDRTILVNFIFTTCNTICPVMSGTFSQLDKQLDKIDKKVELISITIDPEFDTPKVLKHYAEKFKGSNKWKFYTGARDDIVKLQTAFNAYRGSKMNHVPITLIKKQHSKEWVRIDGFASADILLQKINQLNTAKN